MSAIFKPLAALAATVLSAFGVLSIKSTRARYYFNLTLYLSALGFSSFLGVVYGVALSLVGQRLNINYLVARSFYYLCSPLIGIDIIVEGREHLDGLSERDGNGKRRSAVLLGNHQTMMDILYLGRIMPLHSSIMAKRSLKFTPLLGQFMSISGTVFIDRGNREDAVRMMKRAGEEMKRKGISLFVFPEGTRTTSPENNLLPFKKGAFHLAVQASVPIIPIVCENYNRLYDGKSRFDRGTLRLRVLPPVDTQGLTSEDVNDLAVSVRDSMLEALNEISVDPSSTASTRPGLARSPSSTDSTRPLRGGIKKDSADYGTEGRRSTSTSASMTRSISDSEVRRRNSQNGKSGTVAGEGADDDERARTEMAEAGALEEGLSLGISGDGHHGTRGRENVTGDSTDDEVDEEGAVLIQRPH